MNTPRFLIAKYVPNLQRMEPRNFGLILWSDGQIEARFIGEDAKSGELVGYPNFISVKNRPVYSDWIYHWREKIAAESLPGVAGHVPRDAPDFLNAIRATSRENFLLVDGGVLFSEVRPQDIRRIADSLFLDLIDDGGHHDSDASINLDRGWKRVVAKSGLKESPKFHPHGFLRARFHNIEREYKFTAVIGNGSPEAAMQKVAVSNTQSVNNASWMFDGLRSGNWKKNRLLAFYYASPEDLTNLETKLNIDQLNDIGTAINVIHPQSAVKEFKALGIDLSVGH